MYRIRRKELFTYKTKFYNLFSMRNQLIQPQLTFRISLADASTIIISDERSLVVHRPLTNEINTALHSDITRFAQLKTFLNCTLLSFRRDLVPIRMCQRASCVYETTCFPVSFFFTTRKDLQVRIPKC